MFKKLIPLIFLITSATTAFGQEFYEQKPTSSIKNNASLFLGFSFTLGGAGSGAGTPGLTLKVLSTNKRNAVAASAGVTYNFDGTLGCDIGLGYNSSDATLTLGYDICKRGVQFGLGATTKPKTVTTMGPGDTEGPGDFMGPSAIVLEDR